MNPGQEMFEKFFKGIVKEGKEEEANAILKECFKLQEEGKFNAGTLAMMMPRMFAVIRPESIDKLKEAMASFSKKLD